MLQSHRRLSVASIASHWEISERTVYRDIAALCEAGVPIVFEPTLGYRLMGGYEVPPVMFSEEEALALFLSGEIAEKVADSSLKASIRSALLKIHSVLPEDKRSLLEDFKKSLGIWLYSSSPDIKTDCLIPIHNAVLQRKCMRIEYDTADRGLLTDRVVEPLGILYYGNHWHLIAYCRYRSEYRDFRMDRVKVWQVMDQGFSGHRDFSLKDFVSNREVVENLIPVTVVVKAEVVARFRPDQFSESFRETKLPNGEVRYEFYAFSLEWFAHRLLGFGAGVKVEQPAALRETVRMMARAVFEQYG